MIVIQILGIIKQRNRLFTESTFLRHSKYDFHLRQRMHSCGRMVENKMKCQGWRRNGHDAYLCTLSQCNRHAAIVLEFLLVCVESFLAASLLLPLRWSSSLFYENFLLLIETWRGERGGRRNSVI